MSSSPRRRGRSVALVLLLVLTAAGSARAQATLDTPATLPEVSAAIRTLTERVSGAVVQIFAQGYVAGTGGFEADDLLSSTENTGSGVLLSPDGYIVTNAHVVAGAFRTQILLPPGEPRPDDEKSILRRTGRMMGAQLVGIDLETDLAVLRVSGQDLPFLELADSDEIHQGQLVFAFGSPLGLNNSVSMGIVSSMARQLGPENPMIYIQTDATINPGNSGGPLVDNRGRVIGINTLILSQSGGSEGIGFAAPANIVRNVFEQIRDFGTVRRGQIGVNAQTITPTLAEGLGLDRHWGVILGDVIPDSPGDKGGLRAGDVVLSLDGKAMENGRQFDVNLYRKPIGRPVAVEVIRGGQPRTFEVVVEEREEAAPNLAEMVSPSRNLVPELGILALDLDADLRRRLPPLRFQNGVLVAATTAPGYSMTDAFHPGDVIHEVNGQRVASLEELRSRMKEIPFAAPVTLQTERQGGLLFVALERK